MIAANLANALREEPCAEGPRSRPIANPQRFYHAELDGLRFFAFFAVFVYHTLPRDPTIYTRHHVPAFMAVSLGEVSRTGRFGVELFFVLSGYLITELLMREHEALGRIDVRSFYVRRALRIWPIYFLMVGIGLLAAAFFGGSQGFRPRDAVWFLLFSGNWAIGLGIVHSSLVVPLWTVNVEEQFYLVWPLLIRRPSRARVLRVVAALVAVAWMARIGWTFLAPPRYRAVVANDTLAHLDFIAGGGALSIFLRERRPLSPALRRVLGGAGLAAILTAGAVGAESGPSVVVGAPLALIGCLALFCGVLVDERTASPLKHPALVYLGRISYGLYIYHYVVLVVLEEVFGARGALVTFRGFISWWSACLATTIAISALSHAFIERPFMRLKRRFTYVPSRPLG